MTIVAKICGLKDAEALTAALDGGAGFVGFVFYPPSPRALTPSAAGALAARVPDGVTRVGLLVDASDDAIAAVLAEAALDLLQLHGEESPERVAAIKARFRLPAMKAIKVAARADIAAAEAYEAVADLLLFDAKPPRDMADALPGGNGLVFDWNLLRRRAAARPWMLSGGLDAGNVADAVRISGATMVDVSSGVESAPGRKDPARIKAFLDAVRAL
jgi:phosphoribosylanthranilate isomerase